MSRCEQFWKPGQIFAKWSLGLGFLGTESRARILLKLSSLGLGFPSKGLGVSASLGFYHSPPLTEARLSFISPLIICEGPCVLYTVSVPSKRKIPFYKVHLHLSLPFIRYLMAATIESTTKWSKQVEARNEYVWVIDQVWGQDGWILAEFFFCVFIDLDFVSVHKLAKKNEANTQPSWPIKLGQ